MVTASHALSEPCTFVEWTQYRNTNLYKHPSKAAYLFQTSSVKVDADGAPNAYHPDDIKLHCTKGDGFKGLDCPANAGYPDSSWWPSALLPDPNNSKIAYVQPSSSPYAGFFVSQTSLYDSSKTKTDPARYVDSRNVPYIVLPGKFYSMLGTGVVGDFGYAINASSRKASPFVVAEIGPPNAELGEMSIALATALGGVSPNPRTGAGTPKGKTIYVIFPKSRLVPSWPHANEKITSNTEKLLQSIGGPTALTDCNQAP